MPKLLIRIITNLLVNKLITKLFDVFLRNNITVFRFKNDVYMIIICLLVDIKAVSKLVSGGNYRFFGV